MEKYRNTTQRLMPLEKPESKGNEYDIYPAFDLGKGKIKAGYDSLAKRIAGEKIVVMDGYSGVFFDETRKRLDESLGKLGIHPHWISAEDAMKSPSEIDKLTKPFLGGDDPLFGYRTSLTVEDFLDEGKVRSMRPDPKAGMNILIGPGAASFGWNGLLVYLDIPKNEIQFRSRAGSVKNFGAAAPLPPKQMYKRFYFVDWVVMNRHKSKILNRIDIFGDAQRAETLTWAEGDDIRHGLDFMAHNGFRVRPWFEPGAWGGQWIKEHIRQLPSDVPNYAWSFELISPENGLLFQSGGLLLEVGFETLMAADGVAVTGRKNHSRYGNEFPIRMDYLDTFDGGNLSVQCHPRKKYIQKYFGEVLTQEETYYILDAKEGSHVYIGFKNGVNPSEFRDALKKSAAEASPLDVDKFINTEKSSRGDLYLIPPGTLHSAGSNNLVLEISTTPYIFTFKMYDWLRMDLDGKPRPLNIDRAMDNLYFSRQGKYVKEKLISHPFLIAKGDGWEQWEMPTHSRHTYRIQRYEVETEVEVKTEDNCNVINLVDGERAVVETAGGLKAEIHFGETYVVSAAAGSYTVKSPDGKRIRFVRAFMK